MSLSVPISKTLWVTAPQSWPLSKNKQVLAGQTWGFESDFAPNPEVRREAWTRTGRLLLNLWMWRSLLWAHFTLGSAVGNLGRRSPKGSRANFKNLRPPLSGRSLCLLPLSPLSLLITLRQKEFLPLVAAKRLKQKRKVKLYICLIFHQKWSWHCNLCKYYIKYK